MNFTEKYKQTNPPVFALIDTNIWIYSTKLLRTPVARAFLHALRCRNGRILLPEVYEMEIIRHSRIHGNDELQKANDAIRKLRTLSGLNISRPPSLDFEALARERIGELESLIERLPFEHQHARNALVRVMEDRPPSKHKKQEFKDSAAWEALITMRNVKAVALITSDGDFADTPKSKVLSSELIDEAKAVGLIVNLFPNITSYLSQFADHVPAVEPDLLTASIVAATESELRSYAEMVGLELQAGVTLNFNAFLTEREGVLGIDFVLNHTARPSTESEFYPDVLIVRVEGQSTFDLSGQHVSNVSLERIVPLSTDGEELRGKLAFGMASLWVGTDRTPLRIKEKIPLDVRVGGAS